MITEHEKNEGGKRRNPIIEKERERERWRERKSEGREGRREEIKF